MAVAPYDESRLRFEHGAAWLKDPHACVSSVSPLKLVAPSRSSVLRAFYELEGSWCLAVGIRTVHGALGGFRASCSSPSWTRGEGNWLTGGSQGLRQAPDGQRWSKRGCGHLLYSACLGSLWSRVTPHASAYASDLRVS